MKSRKNGTTTTVRNDLNRMGYVSLLSGGGIDCHDDYTENQQLSFNGDYLISKRNFQTLIMQYLFSKNGPLKTSKYYMSMMKKAILRGDDRYKCPIYDETYELDPQITWCSMKKDEYGDEYRFYFNYSAGQFTSECDFLWYEIPKEDVVYAVVDEIKNPHKYCDRIDRIFHMPFHNLQDAQKFLQYMNGKNRFATFPICENTDAKLCIMNCKKEMQNEYLKREFDALNIMMEHNLLWDVETLHPFQYDHIKVLEEKYGAAGFSYEATPLVCIHNESILGLTEGDVYQVGTIPFVDEIGIEYVKVFKDDKFLGWIERNYFE